MKSTKSYFDFNKHLPEIEEIFYNLLDRSLLLIRSNSGHPRLGSLIADHVYQIPKFLRNPRASFIEHYLEENEWFRKKLIELGYEDQLFIFNTTRSKLEQLMQANPDIKSKEKP